MVKVNMPSVPLVVPVRIMPRDDMITKVREPLIRLPCDLRTRTLCASATDLALCVRWMPKRREAGSRAFKGRSTTSGAHSAKADATSAGASSTWDGYATAKRAAMEPTAAEVTATATKATATARVTATTEPTATESSTTTAAVTGRPCYGTDCDGYDPGYQTN
jgi:hypothetical protein